jgi:hypothetical protein
MGKGAGPGNKSSMKTPALFLVMSLASIVAYGQIQKPCPDGHLVWEHWQPVCEADGQWHFVMDQCYLCPPDNQPTVFRILDDNQASNCVGPPPKIVGFIFEPLPTNCSSPTNTKTIYITECSNGYWQINTYLAFECVDDPQTYIQLPPISSVPTTTPCNQAVPVPSTNAAVETPCNPAQLVARNVYSMCETDGFWHVVEDDSYICPSNARPQIFRVSDVPTPQPCQGRAPAVVGTVLEDFHGNTNCQAPAVIGSITVSLCTNDIWEQSTYLLYQCVNGTRWISLPAIAVTTTNLPCTNPPPNLQVSSLIQVPQGYRRGQYSELVVGPSAPYAEVQVSSNLTDWLTLVSISPFTNSYSLVDTNAAGESPRFYRSVLFPLSDGIRFPGAPATAPPATITPPPAGR